MLVQAGNHGSENILKYGGKGDAKIFPDFYQGYGRNISRQCFRSVVERGEGARDGYVAIRSVYSAISLQVENRIAVMEKELGQTDGTGMTLLKSHRNLHGEITTNIAESANKMMMNPRLAGMGLSCLVTVSEESVRNAKNRADIKHLETGERLT